MPSDKDMRTGDVVHTKVREGDEVSERIGHIAAFPSEGFVTVNVRHIIKAGQLQNAKYTITVPCSHVRLGSGRSQ